MAEQNDAMPARGDQARSAEPENVVPAIMDRRKRKKMVGWYDPMQLGRTAMQVAISTLFGRHADNRLLEALVTGHALPYDHRNAYTHDPDGKYIPDPARPLGDIWIDYVGDVGDGWNSTYAVASMLAQPGLMLTDPDGGLHTTERGSILVFGGDQVYPTASRSEYDSRLVAPYTTALGTTADHHPHVYAIPGNHDWYDSLASFTRLFCSGRWFAGWRSQQCRSYFALQLPRGWWLVGTDVQLDSDIDAAQVDYFRDAAKLMQPGDRVILCTAEPHWIYAKEYGTDDADYNELNLAFLEEKVFEREISVYMAGDLHHYRRHESADGVQKITAGGGGAFLHPTHGADVSELAGGFVHKASFPDPKRSWLIGLRNFAFPALNLKFGVVTAVLYLLSMWPFMRSMFGHSLGQAVTGAAGELMSNPFHAVWFCATLIGFLLFTDTHSKPYRYIAGTLHGAAHVVAAFLVAWVASALAHDAAGGAAGDASAQILLSVPLIFIGGWIVGSFIMGIYLFISLNIFTHHANEAFSSLAIPDWKNFLRLHIDAAGDLTIYPVGIRRVPRKWRPTRNPSGMTLVSDDPRATAPELIEKPVVVRKSRTANAVGGTATKMQ